MEYINIKGEITKSQAINIVTKYAEKQIRQEKDWQTNYPYKALNEMELNQIQEAERAIRIVKKLKPNKKAT
jgi:hypothetical protein